MTTSDPIQTRTNPNILSAAHSLLVVDDDPLTCTRVKAYFEREGYCVRVAANGDEMWDSLRQHPTDVVLLDIGLPGRDGLELARELRAQGIDVIALTIGEPDFDSPRHAIEAAYQAALAGDTQRAMQIQFQLMPVHKQLFVEANPIPVKWAMKRMGLCGSTMRLPMTPLSTGNEAIVESALRASGLI